MSQILALPLFRLRAAVQVDEDLLIAIEFTRADGVTPIALPSSATFEIAGIAELTIANGEVEVMGEFGNVLLILAPAATKSAWPTGDYPISLQVSDGTYTRDLLAAPSKIRIGAPQIHALAIPAGAAAVNAGALATLLAPAAVAALSPFNPGALFNLISFDLSQSSTSLLAF